MEKIRVLIAGMPKMLNEIVTRLVGEQEDMEISSVPTGRAQVTPQSENDEPTVVLMFCSREELPAKAKPYLAESPSLKVLALTGSAREATLYELRPHMEPMGPMSPEALIETIRKVARC